MPKLYINKNNDVVTNGVTSTTAISRIDVDRLDTEAVEVFFHDGISGAVLEAGSTGLLVVKKKNDPNGAAILYVPAWTLPPTVTSGYLFSLLVASEGLSTALANLQETTLAMQIVWTEAGKRHSTAPIDLVVRQTYWLGTEEVPVPDPPFPLPGEILTTVGNLAGLADLAVALSNLGLGTMLFRQLVALPGVNPYTANGAKGDASIERDGSGFPVALWLYTGDGETTHNRLRLAGTNAS